MEIEKDNIPYHFGRRYFGISNIETNYKSIKYIEGGNESVLQAANGQVKSFSKSSLIY